MAVYPYPNWEITVQEEQEEQQEEQNELDTPVDYTEIGEEADNDNDESYSIPQDTLSEPTVENNALRRIHSNNLLNTLGFFAPDDISRMSNDDIQQRFRSLSEEMISRGLPIPTLVR